MYLQVRNTGRKEDKEMTFRTYFNSIAKRTIKDIIRTEDLNATITVKDNAVGDTIIEVAGPKEDIRVLADIFQMVR